MKKITPAICLLFLSASAFSQNGLENIIVEKYYISNANDTTVNADGGVLPVGSVTYRVYVNMLPDYRFQAAYGVNTPGADHELRIETTTLFFNNEDRGATSPTFSKVQAANNTVMLDSWLTVGSACTGNFGILKSQDDGVATVVNNDGVLQNNDPAAGIPLTDQDGFLLVSGRSPEQVTAVGITTEIAVFDAQNDGTNGPLFSTWNGSWASLNGSIGPDSIDNKVLIAQITTDGIFSFELNIQIGTPTGGVENYVALNPVGTEIQLPSLIYNSSTDISTPANILNTGVKVYPNPATSHFYIEAEGMSYTIYNTLGDFFGHNKMESSNYIEKVDVSGFGRGIYLVVLTGANETRTQKLIVD